MFRELRGDFCWKMDLHGLIIWFSHKCPSSWFSLQSKCPHYFWIFWLPGNTEIEQNGGKWNHKNTSNKSVILLHFLQNFQFVTFCRIKYWRKFDPNLTKSGTKMFGHKMDKFDPNLTTSGWKWYYAWFYNPESGFFSPGAETRCPDKRESWTAESLVYVCFQGFLFGTWISGLTRSRSRSRGVTRILSHYICEYGYPTLTQYPQWWLPCTAV